MNREEGQLWIDRNAPYGLKYHTHGNTYQLAPEKIYSISGTHEEIKAGSVVAASTITNSNDDIIGTFKLAQFPVDIDRVIGICPIDIPANSSAETAIIKSGILELELPAEPTDSTVFEHTGLYISWDNDLIGAPVYWFIGRIIGDDDNPVYIEPSENKGKLTLATPSGMKWKIRESCSFDSSSLNVGYSNLPIIGTVVGVENGKVRINVNVSKFESELEWHWPYCSKISKRVGDDNVDFPADNISGSDKIIIRHGLFPKNSSLNTDTNPPTLPDSSFYNFRPRCFCEAVILGGTSDDTEHKAFVGVDNYYGKTEGEQANNDPRTEIIYKSNIDANAPVRINISGKVIYTFLKQYENYD